MEEIFYFFSNNTIQSRVVHFWLPVSKLKTSLKSFHFFSMWKTLQRSRNWKPGCIHSFSVFFIEPIIFCVQLIVLNITIIGYRILNLETVGNEEVVVDLRISSLSICLSCTINCLKPWRQRQLLIRSVDQHLCLTRRLSFLPIEFDHKVANDRNSIPPTKCWRGANEGNNIVKAGWYGRERSTERYDSWRADKIWMERRSERILQGGDKGEGTG